VTGFQTVVMVDWSAGRRSPARPSKDAIWIGMARDGRAEPPQYCRTRQEAERQIVELIRPETEAGRRVLIGFDFPFGYPKGFARAVTGSDDPFALWDWLAERITDAEDGQNNRYDVAAEINRRFSDLGPFWGKPNETDWPDIPYRKAGISFEPFGEKRRCDLVAKAASSCFQLAFPPTVGGQVLTGLPVLSRLRRLPGVAVWPFEPCGDAQVVLAEIWPGLIEPVVQAELTAKPDQIRDAVQVTRLAQALSRLPTPELTAWMSDLPSDASEEAWILGAGQAERLTALAQTPLSPPPLQNDCFALPPGVDWTPVSEALTLLRDRLTPVTSVETQALDDCIGRVLAEDVVALRSNPPQANSAVDGYGFAGGVDEGAHEFPLVAGRSAAGVPFDGTVPVGHAIRILTGATLPDGVDTVVLEEDVTTDGPRIALNGPLKRGANARRAGEDIAEGATALFAGRVLTPADLALAAATGHGRLAVRRTLTVAVLSTGDELREPGDSAGPGQIFDANRPMLLALARQMGFAVRDMGRVPDDRATLRATLDQAAREADVILTSGGASAGDEDHVSALLGEAGALHHWRIALKPGRPLALALWQGKPVFGLPGNPVAALTCALIFAVPALWSLAGAGWREPMRLSLPAGFEKRKKPGRREYLRARLRDGRVEIFRSEGSGLTSGLSWAEGLVELDDGPAHIQPGDTITYLPFSGFSPLW